MARKRGSWPDGQVAILEHDSRILADNPLGDASLRRFPVWLPPGYGNTTGSGGSRARGRKLPVLFDLTGYTGSGWSHTNWQNFAENVPERLARLLHEGRIAPCIVVFPDCFTALGGNQYINSSAIGDYADYLTRELIPFIDAEFLTHGDREHRGCFGKSSGGYGAMIHGMRYPRFWGAIANHSGDAYFDFVYRSAWPETLTHLARYRRPALKEGRVKQWERSPERDAEGGSPQDGAGCDDGRIKRFLDDVWQREKLDGTEIMTLMNLCMAASYDPDPKAPNGFRVPFDLDTGELIPNRWRAWLRHDPVHLVRRFAGNLKRLRGIYIDCGWKDQYHIHYGSRILSRELHRAGVEHRYEEFDGTHSGIDHRMDQSLPFLSKALK
ncbi:MAG: alpha/beta hydrolase [Pseudomonadales bacterium]